MEFPTLVAGYSLAIRLRQVGFDDGEGVIIKTRSCGVRGAISDLWPCFAKPEPLSPRIVETIRSIRVNVNGNSARSCRPIRCSQRAGVRRTIEVNQRRDDLQQAIDKALEKKAAGWYENDLRLTSLVRWSSIAAAMDWL